MECDIHLDLWILCVIHQYSPMPLDEAIYSALIRLLWSISEKLHVNFWICAGVYTCMCVCEHVHVYFICMCVYIPGFSILLHGFHCENWLYSFDWYGITYQEMVILYWSARINLSRQKYGIFGYTYCIISARLTSLALERQVCKDTFADPQCIFMKRERYEYI